MWYELHVYTLHFFWTSLLSWIILFHLYSLMVFRRLDFFLQWFSKSAAWISPNLSFALLLVDLIPAVVKKLNSDKWRCLLQIVETEKQVLACHVFVCASHCIFKSCDFQPILVMCRRILWWYVHDKSQNLILSNSATFNFKLVHFGLFRRVILTTFVYEKSLFYLFELGKSVILNSEFTSVNFEHVMRETWQILSVD